MTERNVDVMDVVRNALESDHGEVLRELLAEVIRVALDAGVSAVCGAEDGERTDKRVDRRNGYRRRPLETRVGALDVAIPKLRKESYCPSGLLTPRRRWEQAFVNVVSEAYVLGLSARKVEALVESMGAKGMSKSEGSRMAAVLDEQVEAFRSRQLDGEFPYVWLDALYMKVRENGRVVSKAALVAFGVNGEGEREVLGVQVARTELESSWRELLRDLVARGLEGVKLVFSDAHEGLRTAITAVLNGVSWQRCYVHFIRNVLDQVPRSARGMVAALLYNVFQQTTLQHAREAMTKAIETLERTWPRAAELCTKAEEDVLACFGFPDARWRQIRSTNPLERLNKELRRRVRAVGIFPTEAPWFDSWACSCSSRTTRGRWGGAPSARARWPSSRSWPSRPRLRIAMPRSQDGGCGR